MIGIGELNTRISKILPEIVEFRHTLHQIPEIAGKEWKTSAEIRKRLAPLNLDLAEPFLDTDVIALLNGEKKHNLTFRADMDALPLEELTPECPYRSRHPGMMHACGHDGHVAMLYGTAKILSDLREEVPCSIRFLFQPGEEMACMAKSLLEAGALNHPEPDFITGLHIWPEEPYGKICTKPGVLMAAAGFFRIVLHGKGGHGSLPGMARNPIGCAAELITTSREIVPSDCILTFCACNAGHNNIVIPEMMELKGTIRFTDPPQGEQLKADFEKIIHDITSRWKINYEWECPLSYMPVVNRKEAFEKVRKLFTETCGEDSFHTLDRHTMSSEDFSWYLQKYPGLFCHLGAGSSRGLHSPQFDFDDRLLSVGIRYFCLLALRLFRP